MSLKITKKVVERIPPVAAGSYLSTCIGVIDLGEQREKFPGEKVEKYVNKVVLIFELDGETVEVDGESKPRWISTELTASLNEKSNLGKILSAWVGEEFNAEYAASGQFDLQKLAGRACILNVSVKEKDDGDAYNKVTGVSGLPKGIPAPGANSETMVFDIDERDEAVLETLPGWIQEKIRKSTQYQQDLPDEPLDSSAATAPPKEENPIDLS